MIVKGIPKYLKFLVCLTFCFALGQPCFAQTDEGSKPMMAIKRIALVDLDGVLRDADANNRIRELLDCLLYTSPSPRD